MTVRHSLEAELRISPRPILVVMVGFGQVLALVMEATLPYGTAERAVWLFLTTSVLSAAVWFAYERSPQLGRWMTIALSGAMIYLASLWWQSPEILALSGLSVALAVTLISIPAAIIVAAVNSLLVPVALRHPAFGSGSPSDLVALVGIWALLGVLYARDHQVRELSDWLESYFLHAQHAIAEARSRRAELEQAMEKSARASRQLALANERAIVLREAAEEAQKAKASFVARVSHEFRTPLNLILGLIDLIVESPGIYDVVLSPKLQSDLRTVHRNAEHLSNMVNDILDLTQLDAERVVIHRERVDLLKVVESCAQAVTSLVMQKGLVLAVEASPELSEVYCDPTRTEQVILNLVSNAARFTEQGGITVKLSTENSEVLVIVEDTGAGISHDDIGRIFEPFWRNPDRTHWGKGGSGLGLSISRKFVELQGGRMWVDSQMGVGTSFYFTLPISPPIEPITRPGHMMVGDWMWYETGFRTDGALDTEKLTRPRILLLDQLDALGSRLHGFSEAIEFVSVNSSDDIARALLTCPAHAVVLNCGSEDDPWSLSRAIADASPTTPVIACSVESAQKRLVDVGASGYLTKPVTRLQLEQVVQDTEGPVRGVLLVDDDTAVLELFARMLEACDADLKIYAATSGQEALAIAQRNSPDLVLLDIGLPDMSGWEVATSLSQDATFGLPAIYFVSANDLADQHPKSAFLLATVSAGLSIRDVVDCSLGVSSLLLRPERQPDLALV